ncbi:MAG: DUF11 domain-containing protein, partial [Xanthomonadales bacterium]|nr:DUF11 domain-containing protein [Xanthomonadales bacterium]
TGVHAGSNVTWSNLTVPAHGNLVLSVVVKVNDPIPDGTTTIANLAYKTGTTSPTCPPAGPQCVTIPTEPKVSVAKELTGQTGSDDNMAEAGETLTYTITLTNVGGTKATGQVVNEKVPTATTYVATGSSAWTGTGCVDGAAAGTPCNITVDVPAATDGSNFGTTTLTFVIKVIDPLPQGTTQIFNSVGLNDTPPPACPPGPWCVVIPTPPNVMMEKALTGESGLAPGVAEPGETLTYTITLTNYGGSDATGYAVTDKLDPFVSFDSADNSGVLDQANGVVNWTNLTVPAKSGTKVLTVKVVVADPIPQGITLIANVVYQTGYGAPPCPPDLGPQCVTTPTAPNVAVSKALTHESINQDGMAELGEELTYTITVRNWGGTPAMGTIIDEKVPDFTTYVSGTPTWSCTAGAAAGTPCSVMVDVPAATSSTVPGMITLTFTVKVALALPPGVTHILNSVAINSPPPPCTVTSPTCVVTPTINLSLTKTVTSVADSGAGNYVVTYDIAVVNTGGASTSYTLFDTLDFTQSGVSYSGMAQVTTIGGSINSSLTGGQFTPVNGSQVQISGVGVMIGKGETDRYTVSAQVAVGGSLQDGSCSGQPGNGFYNAADLSGAYDLHSAACAPVTGSQSLITLKKTVDLEGDVNGNDFGDVGDTIGYNFVITNTGTEPLSTLLLFDTRAKGLKCEPTTTNGMPLHVSFGHMIFFDGFDGGLGVLLPLDSISCTGSYVLTQADVTRQKVTNSATVQASAPGGHVVNAIGTATFTLFQ